MALVKQAGELFKGFSKLNREQRFERLVEMGALTQDDVAVLRKDHHPAVDLAESFIENVLGYFPIPLGVAANFKIDGKDYAIPMSVEETSIIAAASKTAKWIRETGEITTEVMGDSLIGQIQIAHVSNFPRFKEQLEAHAPALIDQANREVARSMVARGGGITGLEVREVPREDSGTMAVVHLLVNTCDAMGANILNQICEFLKKPIEALTDETVTLCILSNLNDQKLTKATVILRDIDPAVGHGIAEASHFARQDPYRAATNNKGILNGIDPVLLATGNDWRAVEAGLHAYACRDGQYRSLSRWEMHGKALVGTLVAPVIVGIVGGVTKSHPTAQLSLKMLGVSCADQLSRVVTAVGLVQNLGALTALSTVGIVQGHMRLHIANITLDAGARPNEAPIVKKRLEELLALRKKISLSNAKEILKELRSTNTVTNPLSVE